MPPFNISWIEGLLVMDYFIISIAERIFHLHFCNMLLLALAMLCFFSFSTLSLLLHCHLICIIFSEKSEVILFFSLCMLHSSQYFTCCAAQGSVLSSQQYSRQVWIQVLSLLLCVILGTLPNFSQIPLPCNFIIVFFYIALS